MNSGMMRCYEALGEWEELDKIGQKIFQDSQWYSQLDDVRITNSIKQKKTKINLNIDRPNGAQK